jgi:peptidoglycan/xylan/chitin deacetylase (PgdA/CDA1 family)
VRAPLRSLNAISRHLLPIATVMALLAAASLSFPLTLIDTPPPPELRETEAHAENVVLAAEGMADPHPDREGEEISLEAAAPEEASAHMKVSADPVALAVPALVPLPTATPRPATASRPRPSADLPILMYHHVGPLPPRPDAIRRDLTVSPANFEKQLVYLAESRIQTVHLDALMTHLGGGPQLPPRAVVLTFDDGYDDNYQFAFPLLRKYGMVGTFFITTGFIGKPGYLTWAQIEEMALGGMSIQAHSADHADLTAIRPVDLTRQLVAPKLLLEERLGQPVRFMAYPAGKFNRTVVEATRAAGYAAAVTVSHGTVHVPSALYEVFRVRVRGSDSVEKLAARFTPASWRVAVRQ